jgi:hypothetical protein
MSIQSPTPIRGGLLTPPHELATAAITALDLDRCEDALAALDHRSRLHTVPLSLARRGPHLAFGQSPENLVLLPLRERITHIGRSLTSHVRLEDFRISRDHAILVRHGEIMRLLDNRSANGTFVHGRRTAATTLHDGDLLQVGPLTMRYVLIDSSAAAAGRPGQIRTPGAWSNRGVPDER